MPAALAKAPTAAGGMLSTASTTPRRTGPTTDHGERVQPCSNFAEFSALLPALNDVCCRDGSCVAGLPTQCNVRCAAKLMPLQLACRDFFDANQQATGSLSGMIDSAAALCSGGH